MTEPRTRKAATNSTTKTPKKTPAKTAKKGAAKKTSATRAAKKTAKTSAATSGAKKSAAKKAPKNSLVANINRKKKAGTSRPKSRSTVDSKSYAQMEAGWPKSKAKKSAAKKRSS